MDNMSCRYSNGDTTSSAYLSFDSESTMSTACYKTLEAMSDTSVLSSIGMNCSADLSKTEDNLNSTLELCDSSQNSSPLKTVKKIEISEVKINTPFKALPKNILNEYKALCSTPSKEQLLKTVDVTRGSDATKRADLGLAFLGVDDEKPAYFPPAPVLMHDDNKENILPYTQEISTMSTCSSVEITTSVIETKMIPIICTESIKETSCEDIPYLENASNKALCVEKETSNLTNYNKENLGAIPKIEIQNNIQEGKIIDISEKQEKNILIKQELETERKNIFVKPKTDFGRKVVWPSTCEENLQTNKPSRTLNSDGKRRSLLPTFKKSTLNTDAETEIPLLMSKMLKISNTRMETKKNDTIKNKELENFTPADTRESRSVSLKNRVSLLPSASGNKKRLYSFTQRMSVVVKTTLNSPARKIARKSSVGSIIRQKINEPDNTIKKKEIFNRKSILPKTSDIKITKPTNRALSPLREINSKVATENKSLYPLEKFSAKERKNIKTNGFQKPDILYTCNDCKEKFHIKSLLDAHKRSHESDNKPPSFIKKRVTATQPIRDSLFGKVNQCKYCDKKFALIKALHIHLMQNCSKIPPTEKRKLQYTELNHVEKAQLPDVFSRHNLQSSASSTASSASDTPRYTLTQSNILKSSSESLSGRNKDVQKARSNLITTVNANNIAPKTAAQNVKKISAHAGVYRTPSKKVPCNLCKLTFKSILDYTNHNLTTHSSKTSIIEDNTGKEITGIMTSINS